MLRSVLQARNARIEYYNELIPCLVHEANRLRSAVAACLTVKRKVPGSILVRSIFGVHCKYSMKSVQVQYGEVCNASTVWRSVQFSYKKCAIQL